MHDVEFSRPIRVEHIDKKNHKESLTATADEFALLARRFDLKSIESLTANLTLKITSPNNYHVYGDFKATLTQISVISGKSFSQDFHEPIEAWFREIPSIIPFENAKKRRDAKTQTELDDEIEFENEEDNPEEIKNGEIDLGELVAQFLGLVLPAYPRAQDETEGTGDYIEASPEQTKANPFSALAALKDKK